MSVPEKRKVPVSVDTLKHNIKDMRETLKEIGVDSAEIEVDSEGNVSVRSFNMENTRLANVAQANPSNIQEVAASQLGIINNYYKGVLQQAQQSFRWALISAGVGLVFFIGAIGFLVFQKPSTDSNKQFLGASHISLISGALIEVISGINFYLYARASTQLESFHSRLDRTQRFLLANSVCENLEGEIKQSTRAELVQIIATSRIVTAPEKKK